MDESRALARATGRPLRRVLRTWLAAPVLVRGYPPFRPDPPPWIRPDFAARTGLRDLLDAVEPPDELDDPARSARLRRVTMQDGIRRAQALERRRARFGLGYADPWSDRRVVERVLALPQWMVHGVEEPKRLLRRAMRGIIPPDALERVGKTEPAALFRRGFRERAVDTVRGLLAEPRSEAMGFVDGEALRAAFEDYLGGRPVRHDFWWPVSLEIWLRTREE